MKHLIAFALPVALAACSPGPGHEAAVATSPAEVAPAPPGAPPAPTGTAATLGEHRWQLETATTADGGRIDALFANPVAPLQLEFADGRVSVSNACNRMGGDYTLEAGQITFAPMMATKMACDAPLMAMEREANTRLAGRHALTLVTGTPPRMELVNGLGDRLVFTGAAPEG